MDQLIFEMLKRLPMARVTRIGIIASFVIFELTVPKRWYR